jgi:hypothetical protein
MSEASDKAADKARDAKVRELEDDLVTLLHYRTVITRQLSKIEEILDPITDISPRYEHLSGIAFTAQYILNTRANLIRAQNNVEEMIKLVKREKEKWKIRNSFRLVSLKGML